MKTANSFIYKTVTLVFFLVILSVIVYPQPTLKQPNRIKDFGKSLKNFGDENKKKDKKKTDLDGEEVLRIETNLITSDILVVNQKGNLIAGLKKEEFVVTENGEPQVIEVFAFGENAKIPRSIVLILEVGGIPSLVNESINAAIKLVEKLDSNDRMAIANDNLKLFCDFTKDKTFLKSTLESLRNKRGASRREFSTLVAVLNEMFDAEDIRPIVILQASGDEAVLLKPIWQNQKRVCMNGATDWCERNFALGDVKAAVEKSRATIYGVVPQPRIIGLPKAVQVEKTDSSLEKISREIHNRKNPKRIESFAKEYMDITIKENLAAQGSVVEIAALSGGYAEFLEQPEDADTAYNTIFQTMSNRYVIGYYPKNEEKDGKRRTVKIEVKGHPEYIVMGRKSYVAHKEEK